MEANPSSFSILEQILDRMFADLQSDTYFPMELIGRLQRLSIQQLSQADEVRQAIERSVESKDEVN